MGQRESLNAYLLSVKAKSFEWGAHDCLTFTNDAFRAMHGVGWADDWLDRYMVDGRVMGPKQLKQAFMFSNFTSAVDSRLQRIEHVPPLGSLVTTKKARKWVTGVAMGISTGSKAVFLDKVGLVYLPLDCIDQGWITK